MRDDRALLVRYRRDGDLAAREQFIEQALPLAHHLARRYHRGGEPLDDLMQVASLGLVKAVDRFDLTRTTAFSSFAVPTIVGELKRHFRDKGWSVRVPRDLQDLAVKIDGIADEMSRRLGRMPTAVELAEETGTSLERVLEALEASAAHHAVSLDQPLSEDEDDGDARVDRLGAEDPGYAIAEAGATLQRLMRGLAAREREVIRLRFQEDLTQAEIGARVGISQMHASRIIRRVVAHLREEAAR